MRFLKQSSSALWQGNASMPHARSVWFCELCFNRMTRVHYLVALVLCVLLLGCDAAKKKASSTGQKSTTKAADTGSSSEKKIAAIMKAVAFNPMISLTDNNFTKFVTDRPRDYHAVLMFTATAPKYQCSVCVKSMEVFQEIASFYNKQYTFNETAQENRIAFFRIEVDDGRSIFNELQLETVPRLFMLPPVTSSSPRAKISNYEMDNRVLVEGTSGLLEVIHSTTGTKIEVTVDPALLTLGLGALAILVALFVSAAQGNLYGALLWYQSPKIWVVVSAICFAVGVSGSIFCVIKSAPLFGMSRKGGISIFATQGRDQYLLEGIIIAFMTLLGGLAAYCMNMSTKLRFAVLRHAAVLLSMATWAVIAYYTFETYRLKTGWYNLKDTLPPEVWHFLSASVKKTSGLPKRLLRLAEVWLFDAKASDWPSFQKRAQALVVDYLLRKK